MIINKQSLDTISSGFKGVFNQGINNASKHYLDVAMRIPSTSAEETYSWLGQLPSLREWVGQRVVKNLVQEGFTIKNKLFESTLTVPRTALEDDNYGVYAPLFSEMGRAAGDHPDELIFGLLAAGFTTQCYDRQYFFDTDHPVNGQSVSNMQAGSGTPWFLLDTSRAIKPLIYQERMPYELQRMDKTDDERVFFEDSYYFGVRARSNAGYGLWQLAFASKADLTPENYAAARAAMAAFTGDECRPLGIRPDTLVVPPSLEADALALTKNELIVVGGVSTSNQWANTAKLIVSPWLS